jgi:imidazolonepropionase-like amidohydrolase
MFDGARAVPTPVVVFDGGTIVAVGEEPPAGTEVTDLGDVTLLPGLVDAHQHLVFDGSGTLEEQVAGRSDDELRDRARRNARRAVAAGITTIRDLGDRGFVTLALRDDPDLPTILAAGPPLTADGGHCWFLGGCCAGTAALLDAVAERARRGCDVVKVMVSGGALTPAHPMWVSQFTAEQVALVVAAAHDVGLPVAAHCHGIDGTIQALDAGVDTIEHCSFFTSEGRSEPDLDVVDRIVASGTPVSATCGLLPEFAPPPFVRANRAAIDEALAAVHRRGGTVVVGTDAGINPGKPHDVLPYAAGNLAALGLDGAGVLTAMTATAARVCGVGGRKGRLAPGFDADLLAVGGDPAHDATALRDVRGVWRAGRVVGPPRAGADQRGQVAGSSAPSMR